MVLVPGADPVVQCGGTVAFASNGFTFANGSVGVATFCDVHATVTVNTPIDTVSTNTTSAITYSYGTAPGSVGAVSGVLGVTGVPVTIVTPPSALAAPIPAGTDIDVTLQAVGGVAPYTWRLAGGSLPPGVSLGPDGHLTGKPSSPGVYTFVAGVSDSRGGSTTQAYRLDIVKFIGDFKVTVTPNPATSGETLRVAATVTGSIAATGTIDVWIAGTGLRCPPPFAFGDPASPVAPVRTAPLDAAGRAQVAVPDLRIDDYGVCVHYGGDANFSEAFAGPIDAFVIKGVLLAPPTVALSAPGHMAGTGVIAAQVRVTPNDTTLIPQGTVRLLADGQSIASATLHDGTAWVVVDAPPAPGARSFAAQYTGDGVFPPATSAPLVVVLEAPGATAIPALSPTAQALLALVLAVVAVQRLRRRR